jgi:nitrogen fixation protein FixH
MLIGLGSMAYVAIDDPHFALEPDYYDKAVHWDRGQAEARASQALGLKLTLAPLTTRANGTLKLQLAIEDRQGLALDGALVTVEAFPNAYASRVEHLTLRETAPGVYEAELGRGPKGLWELRVAVKRAGLSYHEVLRRDVSKGDAA